jgi:hypothetical protein
MIKLKLKIPKPKWSKNEKKMAAICALAISMVLIDRFAVSAWMSRMATLRTQISGLERMLVNQQRLLDRKEQVQGQMGKFKNYLKPGAAPGLQMATFLKELEGIAKANEIDSLEIKPQEGDRNDLYQTFVFDVQALCDYPRWIRFLHAVESSRSLFQVQRARTGLKEGEGEGMLDVYLRLSAISFNEPQTAPAAAAPASKKP